RRAPVSNNTGRISPQPVRPLFYESASNPLKPPDQISSAPNLILPAPPHTVVGNYVGNPVGPPSGSSDCVTCIGNSTGPVVRVPDTSPPPAPIPVKPPTTLKVSQGVLTAKAISLPQPPYPSL